jgi:hypothetical protein
MEKFLLFIEEIAYAVLWTTLFYMVMRVPVLLNNYFFRHDE